MVVRAVRVALLLSALPAAGCGTAANLVRHGPDGGGKVPFGGVQQDVRCIEQVTGGGGGDRPAPKSDADHYPQFLLMLVCAADLPLSLVGDIVTWPYTVAYTCINAPVPAPPIPIVSPPPRQAPPTVGRPTQGDARPMPAPPKAMDKPADAPMPIPPVPESKGGDKAPEPRPATTPPGELPKLPAPIPAP